MTVKVPTASRQASNAMIVGRRQVSKQRRLADEQRR
jgi:hypothetical protein